LIVGFALIAMSFAAGARAQEELNTIPVDTRASEPAPVQMDLDDSAPRIEEIIVTANKRAESIREVAGSVGAVRGEDLEKQNAKDLESFIKLVPGVSLNKQDLGNNSPSIRGITSDSKLGISQAPTGIYIDDVPFTGPYASFHTVDVNPFDLKRVEVLKGPQATLYGSNSFAGTIRYILNKPEMGLWEGKVAVDWMNIDHGEKGLSGEAALNIPIGDAFAIRIAGLARKTPGYIDDKSVGKQKDDVNGGDQRQGRVLAAWQPAEVPLQVNLAYIRQDSHQDDAGFADQPERLERRDTPTASPVDDAFNLTNLTAQYDFDWASVRSSTAFLDKKLEGSSDGSRALGTSSQNLTITKTPTKSTERSFSQELKISSVVGDESPWTWLGGLWFTRYDDDLYLGIHQEVNVLGTPIELPSLPIIESPDVYNQYTSSKGTEYAVFGEVTRTLWDDWTASIGARVYQTKLDSDSHLNGLLTLASTGMPTTDSKATLSEKGVSPKASLKYRISDDLSVYALVSRGFRFGGNQFLDPPAIFETNGTIPKSYKSDTLWNYEVGVRSQWFKRALTLDATAFYLDWKNVQIQRAALGGLYNYVDNVGHARSTGLEITVVIAPFSETFLKGLTFTSSSAFIDAVTTVDFPAGQMTVPSGARLPGTPKFQISNVLSYARQFGAVLPDVYISHSYIGGSPSNIFDSVEVGDYNTVDAGINVAMTSVPGAPTLSFAIKNAFDKRALAGATADPAQSYTDYYFIRPRTLELSFSAHFE